MSNSSTRELYVTPAQRIETYPIDRSVKHLIIDGNVFVEDLLLDYRRCRTLENILSTAKSLTILHLTRSACYFENAIEMEVFFHAMLDMRAVKRISITKFTLPDSRYPPDTPVCVTTYGRIPIRKFHVDTTHGASLSFLLNCFEPQKLSLSWCEFVDYLPECDRLSLSRITPSEGLLDILVEWNGSELTIDNCSFLDKDFVRELKRVMVDTDEPIWPNAKVLFVGYSYTVCQRIYEMVDLRSQL
ncbi:hypothetical protein FA13DRAFT_1796919 [Coprinellus micaceus]|uniref:F-box domain-containing protein n=1 Tax=Coprinellus micaceus TaxID=71717 RepID=A0A4Y7SSY5_COPMI|nr:hypothetical protein FA13DRAFT_1796919 [Coprinellus micaceus]